MIIFLQILRGDVTFVLGLADLLSQLILSFPIDLPSMPPQVLTTMNTLVSYTRQGTFFIRCFIGESAWSFMRTCVFLVLALRPFRYLWAFMRWLIKKLPFVHIRE